jgi:hypothetical protein
MFCTKCGVKIEEHSRFCSKCGQAIAENITENTNNNIPSKSRHKFLTFWLLMNPIGLVIVSILFLFPEFPEYYLADYSSISFFLEWILGLASSIAAILLLRWKKIGFWMYLGVKICIILSNIYDFSPGIFLIGMFFNLLDAVLVYALLHVKKNNSIAWDNLT